MFKLGRIRQAKLLESLYLQEQPFGMQDHLGQAWSMIPEGKVHGVKLRFSPMVAGNVAEVLWHQSQKLAWQADGQLIFEAQVDGLGEIS